MRLLRPFEGEEPAWPVRVAKTRNEADDTEETARLPMLWAPPIVGALGVAFWVGFPLALVLGQTDFLGCCLLAVAPSTVVAVPFGWRKGIIPSTLRRLARRTASLGPLVDEPGAAGWLAGRGLFIAPRRLVEWREATGYHIDDDGVGRATITVGRTNRFTIRATAFHAAALLFGSVGLAWVAAASFSRFGVRLDGLAATSGALAFAGGPAAIGCLVWRFRHQLFREPRPLVLLIDSERVPMDGVRATLERHLGRDE